MRDKSFETKSTQASILKIAKEYWGDECGATAIEYGLIAALIGVLLITGASSVGGSVNNKFSEVARLMAGGPAPIEGAGANSTK